MDNGLSLVQSYEGENIYEEHGLSSTEEEERGANSTNNVCNVGATPTTFYWKIVSIWGLFLLKLLIVMMLVYCFYYLKCFTTYQQSCFTYMFIYNSNRLKWSTKKKFTQQKLTHEQPSEHYTLSKLHDQFKSACLLAYLMASLWASTLASHLRSRHSSSSVSAVGVLAYL